MGRNGSRIETCSLHCGARREGGILKNFVTALWECALGTTMWINNANSRNEYAIAKNYRLLSSCVANLEEGSLRCAVHPLN